MTGIHLRPFIDSSSWYLKHSNLIVDSSILRSFHRHMERFMGVEDWRDVANGRDDESGEREDAPQQVHRTHTPRMPKHKLFLLRAENDSFPWNDYPRPKTRGDCMPGGINGIRPCPFVTCRYHLAVSVNESSGSFTETFPGKELTEMPKTCSLDVADEGGATLEAIGDVLNVTREAARLIESKALHKLRGVRDINLTEHSPYEEDHATPVELFLAARGENDNDE